MWVTKFPRSCTSLDAAAQANLNLAAFGYQDGAAQAPIRPPFLPVPAGRPKQPRSQPYGRHRIAIMRRQHHNGY